MVIRGIVQQSLAFRAAKMVIRPILRDYLTSVTRPDPSGTEDRAQEIHKEMSQQRPAPLRGRASCIP